METERFELQDVAIPLKSQLPAPKFCKLQGKRTEQQIPPKKSPKTEKQRPTSIPERYSTLW